MTVAPASPLIPINDCVLVQLEKTSVKEGRYDTRTNGIVIAIDPAHAIDNLLFLNKRIYFEEYKEGARIKRDGELFCFIKIEDIRGFEEIT